MNAGAWRIRPTARRHPFAPAPMPRTDSLQRLARAALAVGLAVAVVRAFVPFEHGIWLVAYLLLVGFLAPALLGSGEAALLGRGRGEARSGRQAALWAFGTVAVPVGVLADSRLGVGLGSLALLIVLLAMGSVALTAAGSSVRSHSAALAWSQLGLVAFMVISVGVGLLLSWDSPWL